MINETINYSLLNQIPVFERQLTEISDFEVIRDYCAKYSAFPYYSFMVMFALSSLSFILGMIRKRNHRFAQWLHANRIDLNSYLIMGYDMIIVMNLIMMLIK